MQYIFILFRHNHTDEVIPRWKHSIVPFTPYYMYSKSTCKNSLINTHLIAQHLNHPHISRNFAAHCLIHNQNRFNFQLSRIKYSTKTVCLSAYQKPPQYPQEQVHLQEVWKNNLQEIDSTFKICTRTSKMTSFNQFNNKKRKHHSIMQADRRKKTIRTILLTIRGMQNVPQWKQGFELALSLLQSYSLHQCSSGLLQYVSKIILLNFPCFPRQMSYQYLLVVHSPFISFSFLCD